MREIEIEKELIKHTKARGGYALKWVCPGFTGVPDRIILMKKGRLGFVEVKAPGKKPRPIQVSRIKLLKALGFKVFVLDNIDEIEVILNDICAP